MFGSVNGVSLVICTYLRSYVLPLLIFVACSHDTHCNNMPDVTLWLAIHKELSHSVFEDKLRRGKRRPLAIMGGWLRKKW